MTRGAPGLGLAKQSQGGAAILGWGGHLGNLSLGNTAQPREQLQVLAAGQQLEDGIRLRAVAHVAVRSGRFLGHAGGGGRGAQGIGQALAMLGGPQGPPTLDHYGKRQGVGGVSGPGGHAVCGGTGAQGQPDRTMLVKHSPCAGEQGVGTNRGLGHPAPPEPPHLWPASTASPPLGSMSPVTMRNVDVFPAPFTPSSPKHCGCPTDGTQQGLRSLSRGR